MKLKVLIEWDPEVKAFSATCPQLNHVSSCGFTEQEALANLKEAIELYLEPDDIPAENASAKMVELAL